jgi:hypothetical protein
MTQHQWCTSGKYIDAWAAAALVRHGRNSLFKACALDLRDVVRRRRNCDQEEMIDQAGIADRVLHAGRNAAQAAASGDMAS